MSDWWYILTIALVLAAAVLLALQARNRGASNVESPDNSSRDYDAERETGRMLGMSDEDRAWEAASRERSRTAEQHKEPHRLD